MDVAALSHVRFYIANLIVANGNSGGHVAIYAAEVKSVPELPLEISAEKSTD